MNLLGKETRNVQNPALGGFLIWRFVVGYVAGNEGLRSVPLPLVFVVLPVLFHKETAKFAASTNKSSGLRKFAHKFGESKKCQERLAGFNSCTKPKAPRVNGKFHRPGCLGRASLP